MGLPCVRTGECEAGGVPRDAIVSPTCASSRSQSGSGAGAVSLLPDGEPGPPSSRDSECESRGRDAVAPRAVRADLQRPAWSGGPPVSGPLRSGADQDRRSVLERASLCRPEPGRGPLRASGGLALGKLRRAAPWAAAVAGPQARARVHRGERPWTAAALRRACRGEVSTRVEIRSCPAQFSSQSTTIPMRFVPLRPSCGIGIRGITRSCASRRRTPR